MSAQSDPRFGTAKLDRRLHSGTGAGHDSNRVDRLLTRKNQPVHFSFFFSPLLLHGAAVEVRDFAEGRSPITLFVCGEYMSQKGEVVETVTY